MQSAKLSAKPDNSEIGFEYRWRKIVEMWQHHQWLYTVGGFLAGLLITPLIAYIRQDAPLFLQSLVPEALGIAFTVFFINALDKRREHLRRQRELRERLIRDAGSPAPPTAVNAVRELQKRGWLSGEHGLLRGEDLQRANLREATLSGANLSDAIMSNARLDGAHMLSTNLSGTHLSDAHMQGTDLRLANLQNTFLSNANMMYAKLMEANLSNARMMSANLAGSNLTLASLCGADLSMAKLMNADLLMADLTDANLAGADLSGADLSEAQLENTDLSFAIFDSNTRLPDGSFWTRETDLRKFGAKASKPKTNGAVSHAHDETQQFTVESIKALKDYIAAHPAPDETQEIDIPYTDMAAQDDDDFDKVELWDEDDLELFDELFQNGGDAHPSEETDTVSPYFSLQKSTATPFMPESRDALAIGVDELEVGEFEIIDPHEPVDETLDSERVSPYFGDLDETSTDITRRGDLDQSLFKGFLDHDLQDSAPDDDEQA